MKKIYICAVFGLLFASCSTEEGQTETAKYSNEVNMVTAADWSSVITSIEQACKGKTTYFGVKYMISHVESTALANASFVAMMEPSFVTPTEIEVKDVMHGDKAQLINAMNYSATAKTYAKQLLVENKKWSVSPESNPLLSEKEVRMLQFMKDINDPDDDWNGRRPLAFAYGYQTSDAHAVMFAVMAHEYKKIK